jgi:hypothetical protein
MSMLTLNGTVLNVYDQPARTDKKTGEIIPATTRVQLQAENTLQNGQKRIEMHDLKVADGNPYRKLLNRTVRVPVGVFPVGNSVMFYALNGGEGFKADSEEKANH